MSISTDNYQKFSKEDLIREIKRLKNAVKKKDYGLVWMNISEAFEKESENKIPILKEVPDLAIKNNDGKPTHILIEGDNYHALTCLNYTHKGKIDVIYIDPPYNTGSDGFRYKDKRILDKFPDGTEVPKDHSFRHSYWLSFMQKRLSLIRDLLSENGVVFISIDDNEMAQLNILCKEEFNEDNVETMIWHQISTILGAGSGKLRYCPRFRNEHEYIIVIYKKRDKVNFNKVLKLSKLKLEYGNQDDDPRGDWISADTCKGERRSKVNGKNYYTYKTPGGQEHTRQWHFSKLEMDLFLKDKRLYFGKDGNAVPRLKKFVNEKRPVTQSSILNDIGNNTDGKEDLKKIFGNKELFEYPKPVSLIERLIQIGSMKNSIVLDFFAGTGTTGQAVMELNEQDDDGKGNRQFILVTNNEGKIMSDVCYPRIKKVISGYDGIKRRGNSIKYYKTAFIGKNNILATTDEDKVELAQNAGELLSLAENTLYLKEKSNYWQIFEDKNRHTAVYFREELNKFSQFVKKVSELKGKVVVYIFSWGHEEFTDDFSQLPQVEVKSIPQPILEIYKQIYNLN